MRVSVLLCVCLPDMCLTWHVILKMKFVHDKLRGTFERIVDICIFLKLFFMPLLASLTWHVCVLFMFMAFLTVILIKFFIDFVRC